MSGKDAAGEELSDLLRGGDAAGPYSPDEDLSKPA